MNIGEMRASFLQYYDRITNFAAPGYEEGEIDLFLNNAQIEYVKNRYEKIFAEDPSMSDFQRRASDLLVLMTPFSSSPPATTPMFDRSVKVFLPSNFIGYLDSYSTITRTNPTITAKETRNRLIKSVDKFRFLPVGSYKTWFLEPVCFLDALDVTYNGCLGIIYDSYTDAPTTVVLNYIRIPSEMSTGNDCELDEHTHQEIVDIAVRQALQVSKDPRWQTQVQEQQIKAI